MEIKINKTPEDKILDICNCMINSVAYKFHEQPPKITKEHAITKFKTEHARECLFYITSIENFSDNYALKIELDIAINAYLIFILIDNLDVNSNEIKIDLEDDDPCLIILFLWLEIAQFIENHKLVFLNNYKQEEYFFSNYYIYNIVDTLTLLSKKIAKFLNKNLQINLSVESFLNLSMLNHPKISHFINKVDYIPAISENIDALRKS